MKLIYKTKCRLCGTVHTHNFLKSYEKFSKEKWLELHTFIRKRFHKNELTTATCDKCEDITIHDFVYYTPKCGGILSREKIKKI